MLAALLRRSTTVSFWGHLLFFSIPFLTVSPLKKIGPLYVGVIFILISFIFFIYKIKEKRFGRDLLTNILGAFMLINIISLLVNWPGIKMYELFILGNLFFSVFIFWLISNGISSPGQMINYLRAMLWATFLACIYGLTVYFCARAGWNFGQPPSEWYVPRLFGTGGEPQVFGNFLMAMVPLGIANLAAQKGRMGKILASLWMYIIFLALLLTFAVGAWLSLAVSLGVFLAVGYKTIGRWGKELVLVLFAVALTMGLIVNSNQAHIQGFRSMMLKIAGNTQNLSIPARNEAQVKEKWSYDPGVYSKLDRQWLREAAYSMFLTKPLLGVGIGNYGFRYEQFKPQNSPSRPYLPKAHNIYFEILAESGMIGMICFITFIVTLLYRGIGAVPMRLGVGDDLFGVALLSSVIGLLFHGNSFGILVHPYVWVMFGLLAVASKLKEQRGNI